MRIMGAAELVRVHAKVASEPRKRSWPKPRYFELDVGDLGL